MPEVLLALPVALVLLTLTWVSSTAGALAAGDTVARALHHPPVEVARLLRQRRRTTLQADALLWRVGGWGLLPIALGLVALVPWGDAAIVDTSVGVVWVNALDVTVWALVWLLGWGANSVAGLVGGYRFLALGLGYELPLMFAIVAPAMAARSLDLTEVAAAQEGLWYAAWMPVALLAYLIGVLGFAVLGPMAAPMGAGAAGGVLAELSGLDLLVARAGRHALLAAGAAVAVPLFLGGGAGPGLPAWAWVLVKAALLTAALAWVAGRVPTVRVHRFMQPAWTVLLPLVVLQDLVVGLVVVGG